MIKLGLSKIFFILVENQIFTILRGLILTSIFISFRYRYLKIDFKVIGVIFKN